MTKRPWFAFFPQDWLGDPKLRRCSLAARGLWMEMLCQMHEGQPYGHLGSTPEELARAVGVRSSELRLYLAELESCGVFSRAANGTIYSRRMVRDEEKRAGWRYRQHRSRAMASQDCHAIVTADVTRLSRPMSRDCHGLPRDHIPESPLSVFAKTANTDIPPSASPPEGARPTKPKKSKPAAAEPAGFAEFWSAYPRKTAKILALRAFAKLNPTPELLTSILAAVKSQSQSDQWLRDDCQFVPYPATWLNQRRWEDQSAKAATAATGGFDPFPGRMR